MMGLCVHEGTKVRQTSDNHKGVMRSGKKKKKYLIGVYYASVQAGSVQRYKSLLKITSMLQKDHTEVPEFVRARLPLL